MSRARGSAVYIVTGVSSVISPEPGHCLQCVVSPRPGDIRDWPLTASDQDDECYTSGRSLE